MHLENLSKHLSGGQAQLTRTELRERLAPLRMKLLSTTAGSPADTHLKKTVDKIFRLIDEMEEKIAVCLSAEATEPGQADYPDDVNDAGLQQPLLANEPITEHQQDNADLQELDEHHDVPGGNTTIAGSAVPSKSFRQIALDLLTPYTFFTTPLLIGCLIWKAYATKHSQSVANTLDWIIGIIFFSVCV